MPEDAYKRGGQPAPAGLMAGADASAIVTMKVFVEERIIPPVGIGLKFLGGAVHRPASGGIAQENAREAPRYLGSNFKQVHRAP